jgi:DNA-binding NarL/FixJ family response regulator
MCKIAIIENCPLFSAGIKALLNNLKETEIVAEAGNADELRQKTGKIVPDVIIADIFHSENSGVKLLGKIKRVYPKVPVLIITSPDYADFFEDYIRIGVKGFVLSNASSEEFVTAINKLKASDEFFPIEVWKILKNAMQSRKSTSKKGDKLTDREIAVLKLFTQGLTYKEIGLKLNISSRTVETHRNNILSKLKIHTTADLFKYAYHHGLHT